MTAGLVYLARRPREPAAGAPSLDLGAEPPAVANLLANDFRLGREAVPATLLDLAARKHLELEEREPGTYVCRLATSGQGAALTTYEQRILELLRRRVSGGIVPTQALTTGPADESKRWWRAFRKEVVGETQQRGLSTDLVDRRTLLGLSLAAGLPGIAVALAAHDYRAGLACVVVAFVGVSAIRTAQWQRGTDAGLAAASRWLGLRARLGEDEEFARAPPTAVTLWERYLAYGAAFGIAPGAVGPIPMGAESDTRAWSSYGGRWRMVRIRYPRLVPLGWGLSPLGGLVRGLGLVAGAVIVLVVGAPLALDVAEDLTGWWRALALAVLALPAAAGVAGTSLLLRSAVDLWSDEDVTGQILRLRAHGDDEGPKRYYVALDEGKTPTVRAWVVDGDKYASLLQNQVVTATVTRHLRHVRSIERASAPR